MDNVGFKGRMYGAQCRQLQSMHRRQGVGEKSAKQGVLVLLTAVMRIVSLSVRFS